VKEKKYSSEQIKDSSANRFAALPRWERYLSGFMQFLAVLFFYAVAPAPLVLLLYLGVASWQASFASSTLWIAIVALTILGYPLGLLASIALKWIIIGRYRPGSYPLWGWYYFRCWLTFRIQAASGVTLLTGTPIINLYYRLLGMRVGENTILDSAQFGAVDLITIGEDTAIGAGTQLHGFRIESGQMILAPVTVGRGCYIGNHSQLGLNSTMENGAVLDDLSTLPDNFTAKEGVSYRGSPPVGTEVDLTCYQNQSKNKRRPLLMATAHYLMLLWVGILFLLIAIPPLLTLIAAYLSYGINGLVSTSFIWAILGTPYFCLMVAGVKGLTMGRTTPGIYNTHGLYYLKRWSVDLFLTISSQLLHALYTTIYLPSWLRLLGAKIGKRTEISTVMKMTPDLVEIDDESFFADGSMIGGRRFYYGKVHYAKNQIGRRTFIGNNAMLPVGESIGANCLLGVLSLPPRNFPDSGDGSEWLGSPSFRLPHRNQVTIFSDETIYRPTLKLYTQRLLIDGLRILVPSLIALVSTLTYMFFLYYAFYNLTLIQTLATAPLVSIGLALTSALAVVFLKWIIMGVFRPVKKPLWSIYVWCNELINGVYETVGAPLIAPLMGTPFYNWYLRMLGCKIGKHTYIGTSLFSEFDLVNIGDYCALNSGVVVQNHLFEDRVMKSSHLHIGNNCTIGNMSVVLYDSVIRDNSTIAPLSLVMKGDDLPAHSSWEGIPIART
ncbi:MAG: non-ribosomal peptide synthetase, partial [Bdellovibrionales bacterium]|nr:non-ribosomal peptide synthetase [Bdellovibrionales bacterium]